MIVYLDTSALVKRYVAEPGSALVRDAVRRRQVAVSRIAYAELAAAVARLHREGLLGEEVRDRVLGRLDADFAGMTVVEVRASLVRRVPELVKRRALRGYDAVQLAAALSLSQQGAPIDFWSGDDRLVAAARAEELRATLVGG